MHLFPPPISGTSERSEIKNKKEPNEALEPIRVLVTESAISPLRGGTFCANHPNGSV
jgi:hypothetical protein